MTWAHIYREDGTHGPNICGAWNTPEDVHVRHYINGHTHTVFCQKCLDGVTVFDHINAVDL